MQSGSTSRHTRGLWMHPGLACSQVRSSSRGQACTVPGAHCFLGSSQPPLSVTASLARGDEGTHMCSLFPGACSRCPIQLGGAALPCDRLRRRPEASSRAGLVTFLHACGLMYPQSSQAPFPPSAVSLGQLLLFSGRGYPRAGSRTVLKVQGKPGGPGKDPGPPHPFPWSAREAGQEGGARGGARQVPTPLPTCAVGTP